MTENSCSMNGTHGASTSRQRSKRMTSSSGMDLKSTGWYLGINDARPKDTKGHYEFPYGDFKKVHRCGVITAESRAGQYKHFDIEKAAHHLHEMIDARADKAGAKRRGAHHSGPAPHRSAR
jgi:hypothetical protein